MIQWLKRKFINKYAASAVRHLITFLGGLIAGAGVYLSSSGASPEEVARFLKELMDLITASEPVISGYLIAIAGLLLSWMEKRKRD